MSGSHGGGMSRRAFLASTSALALAGLVAPSWGQESWIPAPLGELPPADGPLRYLDIGDLHTVFYNKFFPEYSKARGIEVVFDGLTWNDIGTVVPLGVRNGTAPDVFILPNGMPPSVAVASGWVQPIDELIPDFANWKAGFPAGAFIDGVNVIDGKTYGLPYTGDRRSSSLLLFSKEAMALTEFTPGPDNPLDWDQFRAAAQQITTNSKGRMFGWIEGGNQPNRWADAVGSLAARAGAACGNSAAGFASGVDYRTGEIIVDSPEFVGAVELLMAIRDDGSAFPGLMGMSAPQARAMMPQGGAGMILQGPWNVPLWESENPNFDFGYAATPAPAGKDGKTYTNSVVAIGDMLFINAKAKNPQYAADVFHILGTLEGQTQWASVASPGNPAAFPEANQRANLSERSTGILALQENQVRVSPNPYAKNTGFVDVARLYVAPTPNLAQTVQGLYSGQLSGVKENLTTLKEAMNVALDNAFAAAKAEGANVSRSDLMFPDWDPSVDHV